MKILYAFADAADETVEQAHTDDGDAFVNVVTHATREHERAVADVHRWPMLPEAARAHAINWRQCVRHEIRCGR